MRPIDKNSPFSKPIPIRFTNKQLKEIEEVANKIGMSRAEVIRLTCSAGLVAIRKLGVEGLAQAAAKLLTDK